MGRIEAISSGYAAKSMLDACHVLHVHSAFARVVNLLTSDDRLVSLSACDVSDFPANIRTRLHPQATFLSFGLSTRTTVGVAGGAIDLCGNSVVYGDAPVYIPAIHGFIPPAEKGSLRNALLYLPRLAGLVREPRGLSRVIPLLCKGEPYAEHDFDDPLCQLVWRLSSRLLSPTFALEELPDVLYPLIGRGPGLTPSGDDFIAGLLLTLHLGYRSLSLDSGALATACGAVLSRAHATTRLSRDMLHYAGQGELTHAAETAVLGSLDDSLYDMRLAAASMLSYGASSGLDQLAGIATGLRLITQSI